MVLPGLVWVAPWSAKQPLLGGASLEVGEGTICGRRHSLRPKELLVKRV